MELDDLDTALGSLDAPRPAAIAAPPAAAAHAVTGITQPPRGTPFNLALDGLDAGPVAAGPVVGTTEERAIEAAFAPPPVPKSRPPVTPAAIATSAAMSGPLPTSWAGRAPFEDLFIADVAAGPAPRGSAEEKVEYFRERVKRNEAHLVRFRDAWAMRDRELDILEGIVANERRQGQGLQTKVQEGLTRVTGLERFNEQKKQEMEAYGEKVAAGFAAAEEREKSLHVQLQAAATDAQQKLDGKDGESSVLREQLGAVEAALEASRALRQRDVDGLSQELQSRETELTETHRALAAAQAAAAQAQAESGDVRQALEQDLAGRAQMLAGLKEQLERGSQAEREQLAKLEGTATQLAECQDALTATQQDLTTRDEVIASLRGQVERLSQSGRSQHEAVERLTTALGAAEEQVANLDAAQKVSETDLTVRDEAIGRLKQVVGSQKEQAATHRSQLEAAEQGLAESQRVLAQLREEVAESEQQAQQQVAEMEHAIAARDEAIGKMKTSVQAGQVRQQELLQQLGDEETRRLTGDAEHQTQWDQSQAVLQRIGKALQVAQRILA